MKVVFLLLIIFTSCQTQKPSNAQKAKEYLANQEYDLAIQFFQQHIQTRLSKKSRPEWENPYVYYLDIGDAYLEQHKVEEALKFYFLAEEHQVEPSFISDRLRNIATWYEEHDQLESALEHLQKYQDRDPEFFNMMLDRIAKKYAKENN